MSVLIVYDTTVGQLEKEHVYQAIIKYQNTLWSRQMYRLLQIPPMYSCIPLYFEK